MTLAATDDERYSSARGFLYETNKLMREQQQGDLLSYQNPAVHDSVGPLVRTSFGVGVLMGVRPDGTAEVQLQTLKMYPRLTDIRLLPERPPSFIGDDEAPKGLKRSQDDHQHCPNKRQFAD
ncbi:hypothetical protein FOL47_010602 [Perkinsus chesapeaki]|uniref:Uncharacterized protein n=1 Tax=Perkinsus chesapeaki TaxID=330153 RepID=A0A7J6L141_PERCH|nr:hypothetical protein FOL47_010602 [Perkinsus chesapeaki]